MLREGLGGTVSSCRVGGFRPGYLEDLFPRKVLYQQFFLPALFFFLKWLIAKIYLRIAVELVHMPEQCLYSPFFSWIDFRPMKFSNFVTRMQNNCRLSRDPRRSGPTIPFNLPEPVWMFRDRGPGLSERGPPSLIYLRMTTLLLHAGSAANKWWKTRFVGVARVEKYWNVIFETFVGSRKIITVGKTNSEAICSTPEALKSLPVGTTDRHSMINHRLAFYSN